jgi:hypothetical protein
MYALSGISFPGCVMVARQTLDLLVGVRILPGESLLDHGPFVYRLGRKILNL